MSVKYNQCITKLGQKKTDKPSKIQRMALSLVLAASSTAVLAGCNQNTPVAESPVILTTPLATSPTPLSPSPATTPSPLAASPSPSPSPTSASPSPSPVPTTPGAVANNPKMVEQAEQALKTLYTQQIGAPVESVNCPDNIKFQAGNAFECQATAQKVKFTIQVKMENDQGRFDSQTKGILILPRIEELLEKTVKEKAKIDVNADCGGKLRAAKAGETFTCEIKDNQGQSRKAEITVKDETGNINVKI